MSLLHYWKIYSCTHEFFPHSQHIAILTLNKCEEITVDKPNNVWETILKVEGELGNEDNRNENILAKSHSLLLWRINTHCICNCIHSLPWKCYCNSSSSVIKQVMGFWLVQYLCPGCVNIGSIYQFCARDKTAEAGALDESAIIVKCLTLVSSSPSWKRHRTALEERK